MRSGIKEQPSGETTMVDSHSKETVIKRPDDLE